MAKNIEAKKDRSKKFSFTEGGIILRYFQVVFTLLGVWYFAAGMIYLFSLFSLRFNENLFYENAVLELINYPILSFVPLPLTIAGILFLYAGFKVKMGSKRGFWTGVFVLIFVPLMVLGMNTLIHYVEYTKLSNVTSFVDYFFGTEYFKFNALDLIFYLVFFGSFVVLLLSYKKFIRKDKLISKRARSVLVILFLTGVVPSIIFGIYSYFRDLNTDYGYMVAQEKISFEILEPTWLPNDLTYATYYFVDEDLDFGIGSEVYFDTPESNFFKGYLDTDNHLVGIKQYKKNINKELKEYADHYVDQPMFIDGGCEMRELPDGSIVEGFAIECIPESEEDEIIAKYELIVTQIDDKVVLIESPSLYLSSAELIDIAAGLE